MRNAIHKFGAALLAATALSMMAAEVHLERVPEGALQPSALIDDSGASRISSISLEMGKPVISIMSVAHQTKKTGFAE